MTRIFEFIVAAIIVIVLGIGFALMLPAHGHIERSIDVYHNVRHISDLLSNFRKFPEWGALRVIDGKTAFNLEGPDFGPGAKLNWNSNQTNLGRGSYEVASVDPDHTIVWNVVSPWKGENKKFTMTFAPQKNPRLIKIVWAYDVDYGMDLLARLSGMYLNGEPASQILMNLGSMQAQLASIPNVDYTATDIFVGDVTAHPELFVSTTAPRSLDDVAYETGKAMDEIKAVIKKAGVNSVGPHSIFTTEWGDENYVYDVAQAIDSASIKIDGRDFTIAPAVAPTVTEQNDEAPVVEPKPGELDKKGNLVVAGRVRAHTGYAGKALVTTWIGSPAGLPLMRLSLKAFALSHGYRFNETTGRYFDQMLTDPATTADDEQQFKVYLPITDNVAANEPATAPVAVPNTAATPAPASGQH
ncbi:MAG: hypothetical protein ABI411_00290 [Tahibacter sp.]